MNEGINNRRKKKISLMEIFIPLFCLINQYEIAGLHLGLICVIAVVAIYFIKYREFYLYKPLFIFFLFMIVHDFFRMFITGFNTGLWVERVLYLLILSCIYKKVDEENLFRVWATITEDVKNDQYRISIRSRGPAINRVAEKFGGGGHKYASGVKLKTLDDAMKLIEELDLILKEEKIESEVSNHGH